MSYAGSAPAKAMGAAGDEKAAAAAGGAAAEGEAAADSKDLQQQSKALDKLTDHVEDRQLDSSRVQSAMAALASSKEADWNAMRLREKELAAVKINPTDVEIIANELELDKKIAERTLREHKGDAVAAVRFLLH
ncbi:huntingtin-interacting protein K [Panicum miliaceum]|uniref:Huntingtin-interacting protein K n=1 Tax=Panicum miliaceum TaxID=4540 RepID=A0A3L6TPS5_PANMI|nr:huntingtin-interacting protein K [Panicum miliaceum]